MELKQYRKKTLTVARRLTEADYQQRGGIIQTPEGPSTFQAGDYLARDAKGEWPIPAATIETVYQHVTVPDAQGWASYQPLGTRLACQMTEEFTVDGLTGKAGDYLVRSGESEWPVDREIFEASYELVDEAHVA